jgi:hypothetical protein
MNALGHIWTVDRVLVAADRPETVLEWTQFDKKGGILRGIDWFVFEPGSFRIQEIRAYGAAPISPISDARNYGISITLAVAIQRRARPEIGVH